MLSQGHARAEGLSLGVPGPPATPTAGTAHGDHSRLPCSQTDSHPAVSPKGFSSNSRLRGVATKAATPTELSGNLLAESLALIFKNKQMRVKVSAQTLLQRRYMSGQCSGSLVVRETQTRSMGRNCVPPPRMETGQEHLLVRVCGGGDPHTLPVGMEMLRTLWKTAGLSLTCYTLRDRVTHTHAHECWKHVHAKTCTRMLTAALAITDKKGETALASTR